MKRTLMFAVGCAAVLLTQPAISQVQAVKAIQIDGNEATVRIDYPGILDASLTLRFENAIGLNQQSLGLTVQLIDGSESQLLQRFPDPEAFSLPATFPLLISIEPAADLGLAFEGVVELELYTTRLHYVNGTPLRLFSSSNGKPFRDITEAMSAGSYRARGSGGQFSDFLIASDLRAPEDVALRKFDRLEQVPLDGLDAGTAGTITDLVASARSSWMNGDNSGAIAALRDLDAFVAASADGGAIPNVWHAGGAVQNVAGMLRATARTLRFTLGLLAAG